jgi:hypothetical protein
MRLKEFAHGFDLSGSVDRSGERNKHLSGNFFPFADGTALSQSLDGIGGNDFHIKGADTQRTGKVCGIMRLLHNLFGVHMAQANPNGIRA